MLTAWGEERRFSSFSSYETPISWNNIELFMFMDRGEFKLEVQHTSKVKIKQLYTLFQRGPVT